MKRLFDICLGLLSLIIFSPVLLIVALIVIIDDGFPIVFKQERVGKDNKLFKIRKFRTMKNGTRNTATHDLTEAQEQITRSGRYLRRTSIDELPQLLNILDGTMSFVGPRPLIIDEKEIRELRIKNAIYSVRPGITGWAQINGRDNLSIEQKVELDREYIEKQSLLFDIKILFKTIFVVFKKENITEGGEGEVNPN
ncbi:MAG: sugar transferase [Clostridiales bacterium]|nr:sugar transferase [Clostridiales bacterium]